MTSKRRYPHNLKPASRVVLVQSEVGKIKDKEKKEKKENCQGGQGMPHGACGPFILFNGESKSWLLMLTLHDRLLKVT